MSNLFTKLSTTIYRTRLLYVMLFFWFLFKSNIDSIANVSRIIEILLGTLVACVLIQFFILTLSVKKIIFKSFYIVILYLSLLTLLFELTLLKSVLEKDAVYEFAQIILTIYILFIAFIHPPKNYNRNKRRGIYKYHYEILILVQLLLVTTMFLLASKYDVIKYYELMFTVEFIFASLIFYLVLYFYVYNSNAAEKQINLMLNLYKPGYYKLYGKSKVDVDDKNILCFHLGDDIKVMYKYEYVIAEQEDIDYDEGTLLMFDASSELKFYISKNNIIYNVEVLLEKNDAGHYYVKNTSFYELNMMSSFLHNKFLQPLGDIIFTSRSICKSVYLKFMFDNNVYYNSNIENELDNTLAKKVHDEQNIICINGEYGVGKTTYVSTLTGLLNNNTTFFSYSSYKYEDILSEILLSFTKYFKPHILILVGIFFAVFTFVVSTVITIIDATKIVPTVVIKLYNSLKGALLYMLDVNPLIDTSSRFFKSITETDVLIILSIIFLIMLIKVLKSKETFLLAFNFGTSKTSNNIINAIADKLEKTDKKIIIEDLDRLDFYEDIYYEMLKISKLHNNNSKNINIYLTVGIDILKKKYAEHMISKNLHNVASYDKVIKWCIKDKPCEKCPGRNQCDLYRLLSKNFIIHNTYFKNVHTDYMNEIKNVDYKLYRHLRSVDIIDMRKLKKEIQRYYS